MAGAPSDARLTIDPSELTVALPRYRRRRTGYWAGGGVALAGTVGLLVGTGLRIRGRCTARGADLLSNDCLSALEGSQIPVLVAGGLLHGAVALGATGGVYHGRAAAAADVLAGRPPRRVKPILVGGAIVTGAGVASYLFLQVSTVIQSTRVATDKGRCEGDLRCHISALTYQTIGFAGSGAALSVGAAMLGYATGYRAATRSWVRPSPTVSRHSAGLSLLGRF